MYRNFINIITYSGTFGDVYGIYKTFGWGFGVKQYFIGPMAKQHRMALLTVFTLICVISPIKPDINIKVYPIALAVIILGCIVTVWRRVSYIARDLKEKNSEQ